MHSASSQNPDKCVTAFHTSTQCTHSQLARAQSTSEHTNKHWAQHKRNLSSLPSTPIISSYNQHYYTTNIIIINSTLHYRQYTRIRNPDIYHYFIDSRDTNSKQARSQNNKPLFYETVLYIPVLSRVLLGAGVFIYKSG